MFDKTCTLHVCLIGDEIEYVVLAAINNIWSKSKVVKFPSLNEFENNVSETCETMLRDLIN